MMVLGGGRREVGDFGNEWMEIEDVIEVGEIIGGRMVEWCEGGE